MGIESKPNEFRASLRSGRSDPPVVAKKPARGERSVGGLDAVTVPRSESRSSNEREADRHRLSGERAIVRHGGKDYRVELVNLSNGGAMVAGDFKCRPWDKVELVLGPCSETGGADGSASAGKVECAVRWIRGGRIGLEFAHETRVDCDSATLDELLRQVIRNSFPGVELKPRPAADEACAPDQPEQKRAEKRHPLVWNGILHHDYEWEAVRLRNISTSGALIEGTATLPPGVTVYLDLGEAGRIEASVSWSRGNQSGLAFREPFDVRSLSQSIPEIAERHVQRPSVGGEGQSDQSPWAPQWGRLSVDELGKNLGG